MPSTKCTTDRHDEHESNQIPNALWNKVKSNSKQTSIQYTIEQDEEQLKCELPSTQ